MNTSDKKIYNEAVKKLSFHMHNGLFKYSDNMRDVFWFARRIVEVFSPSGTFVDIGGALNPVNAVLAEMGMQVSVVDFDVKKYMRDSRYSILKEVGVQFIEADGLDYRFDGFADESIDAIGSFHTFEHFHHSPRNLCGCAMLKLRSGGKFVIETPNAANLKKRIGLLFGKTNYLGFDAYYESEQYWLHIREYTIEDMMYLAKRLNFSNWKIFGLNYFGQFYPGKGPLWHLAPFDYALRMRPGLCSAIFLTGTK